MKTIKGIAASDGIAIAKAFKLVDADLTVTKRTITDVKAEQNRYRLASEKTIEELTAIKAKAAQNLGEEEAAVFDAHINMVNDPELVGQTIDKMKTDMVNVDYAFDEVANMFIMIFESMEDEYMRERAADVKDIKRRLLSHLLGVKINDPGAINEEVIVIAEDLTPSDTAQLNRKYALGFATDIGGRTSHSAIMARSLEIPAVVGTKEITNEVENGTIVILDGLDGEVIVSPTEEVIRQYEEKKAKFEAQKLEWAKFKDEPTVTKDGHRVELVANIGTPDDVAGVVNNGGEGVGLYRTEFLYMGRSNFPTEDEQFEAYKAVLEGVGEGHPVVVRTLDIGGDKELPYLDMPHEMNPFLGCRAIRLCLNHKDIFRTQLRALLRASVYGNLKVMFPMIATLEEFREAKGVWLEEKEKLVAEGVAVSATIEIGMMVEIPSSAVIADQFAKEVDFFSIGTNDLIQYTMATDRMNEHVAYLYQPYHPAILRLVKMVIDAGNKEGKWTGMCGEMAGDTLAIPLLLGLGLYEFSMSATSILAARSQISRLSKAEMEKLAEQALGMATADEVVELVKRVGV